MAIVAIAWDNHVGPDWTGPSRAHAVRIFSHAALASVGEEDDIA